MGYYNWQTEYSHVYDNKFLIGFRLYITDFYIGAGAYSVCANQVIFGENYKFHSYWSGYLDFGYHYFVLSNLAIETGGRIFFNPQSISKSFFNGIIDYWYIYNTNNIPTKNGSFYSWDWFVGIKVTV